MKKYYVLAASLLFSIAASAAGFQLNLQGLRQLAMGGSGTAIPWDAATIFYNPAGISRLDAVQAYAAGLIIIPTVAYASPSTGTISTSKSQQFYPFNVYVGGPIKKGSKLGIGLGVYTPFGSGLKWDNSWPGKYLVESIYLQSIFIQPTVSYRINDFVSVGAGFIYAFGNLDFKQAIPISDVNGNDGQADLKGNANGVGFNAGVHLKITKNIQVGVTYRSEVDMKVKSGNANFTVPASLTTSFPNTTFSSTLPLPQVITLGLGYKISKHLTIQADINFINWSSYDSLKFDFAEHTSELQNNHSPRKYLNTVSVRGGACYQLGDKLSLMAGAAYDPTPVHSGYVSPELPDANRLVLTGGILYKVIPRLSLMGALEYTVTAKRDAVYEYGNFAGRYQTKALTPGIGASFNF